MTRHNILTTGVVFGLLIAVLPGCESKKEDPYVRQLEQELSVYTGQVDSLNSVLEEYTGRLREIRTQMDTAQVANKRLVAALQKVSGELKEYRRLYAEQKELNTQLRTELQQVRGERDRSLANARRLKTQVDSLDNQLYVQRSRVVRLEAQLQASLQREAEAVKALSSVFVYAGKREALEKAGYLRVKQQTIFTDSYSLIGFPDIKDNRVQRVAVGGTLTVTGQVRFLVDRHGKLKKDHAYRVLGNGGSETQLSFLETTLEGQRILAVIQ